MNIYWKQLNKSRNKKPKQFHIARFVRSELRVYETVLRYWPTLYYLQKQDTVIDSLAGEDSSAGTRCNIDIQHEAGGRDSVSYTVSCSQNHFFL